MIMSGTGRSGTWEDRMWIWFCLVLGHMTCHTDSKTHHNEGQMRKDVGYQLDGFLLSVHLWWWFFARPRSINQKRSPLRATFLWPHDWTYNFPSEHANLHHSEFKKCRKWPMGYLSLNRRYVHEKQKKVSRVKNQTSYVIMQLRFISCTVTIYCCNYFIS